MICPQCNKEFTQSHGRQKYCSKECSKKEHQSRNYLYRLKFLKSEKGKIYREKQNKYLQSDKGKEALKKYQQSDKFKEYVKQYQQSDKGKEYAKQYRQSDQGKAANKRVYEKRKSKGLIQSYLRKYEKEKRKTDPIFKLTADVRHRLIIFLKESKMRKTNSTFKMVGCTPKFLKKYLEKKFKPGMTWQNHTRTGWHIDHKIPLSSAKTPEAVEKLMHYTNLQPLWAKENIRKSNKII